MMQFFFQKTWDTFFLPVPAFIAANGDVLDIPRRFDLKFFENYLLDTKTQRWERLETEKQEWNNDYNDITLDKNYDEKPDNYDDTIVWDNRNWNNDYNDITLDKNYDEKQSAQESSPYNIIT